MHVSGAKYKIPYIRKNGHAANMYYTKCACSNCGKETYTSSSNRKRYSTSACSKVCAAALRSGSRNANWSGGTRYKSSGHRLVYDPHHPNARKNYVQEHRRVVEKSIGRYLTDAERVHHINMVKDDNRIENLFLCKNHTQHFKAHGSLNLCVEVLMDAGVLIFNKSTGVYMINDGELTPF